MTLIKKLFLILITVSSALQAEEWPFTVKSACCFAIAGIAFGIAQKQVQNYLRIETDASIFIQQSQLRNVNSWLANLSAQRGDPNNGLTPVQRQVRADIVQRHSSPTKYLNGLQREKTHSTAIAITSAALGTFSLATGIITLARQK